MTIHFIRDRECSDLDDAGRAALTQRSAAGVEEQRAVTELGRLLVFLYGGPAEIPCSSRSFHVPDKSIVVSLRFGRGKCRFHRTDRLIYFAGGRCTVFEWFETEQSSSPPLH